MTPYDELEARCRELSHLRHARAILHWDTASMMPPGGAEARGESMAVMAAMSHQKLTHPDFGALLDLAEASSEQLGPWQHANVRAIRRSHQRASAVPEPFVRATQIAGHRCEQAWRVARGNNDWPAVSTLLEESRQPYDRRGERPWGEPFTRAIRCVARRLRPRYALRSGDRGVR